jgi:alpha-amylase
MKGIIILKRLFIIVSFSMLVLFSITYADSNPYKITQQDLIYFMLTDRFYDGDLTNNQDVHKRDLSAYHGGDWQGIIEKLDYIKELGFTTIWISPVVANQTRGYHGYWPTDFYKTNEHFGNMEKLKELVDKAHQKGIKVIVDMVVTHTSKMHPWLSDPVYYNWYHHRGPIQNWNDQQELEEGELANLPHLNHNNSEVQKYLIDMAKWWIRETGIDGYRLDTARHVPKNFWKQFAVEIKKEFPDFYLIGEVFDGRADYVAAYQQAGIDGLEDYPLYFALKDVFAHNQPTERLISMIAQSRTVYPDINRMGTFIDNQDVSRFMSETSGQDGEAHLKQALAFEMTYTGIPIMYYGTEIGLEGQDDPNNRRDMDWSVQLPLTGYIKTLIKIRKANKALTCGDFQIINTDTDFLCYLRRSDENVIITLFNLSDQKKRVEFGLPVEFQSEKGLITDLMGSSKFRLIKGKTILVMNPYQVNIFSYGKR